jgi:hypothetical protein
MFNPCTAHHFKPQLYAEALLFLGGLSHIWQALSASIQRIEDLHALDELPPTDAKSAAPRARRCLLASFRSLETRCRAYLAALDTRIRPRIYGWKLQKYKYVPGRVKRCIHVAPESMGPESNALLIPVTV